MSKPTIPRPDRAHGVEEAPAVYDDGEQAATFAALEEYRRTGVSYSVDEAEAELDRLIAERRARKA